MNKVQLVGRLSRDVEVRTAGDNAIARTSIAVTRRFKNKDGVYEADFINVTAFGKTAEFLEKFFKKGDMIGIVGRITTGSYEKDGQRVYTTEVTIEEIEFVGGRNADNGNSGVQNQGSTSASNFVNIPDGVDEALPFN